MFNAGANTVEAHGLSRAAGIFYPPSFLFLVGMLFVLLITLWSLGSIVLVNLQGSGGGTLELIIAGTATAFIVLAIYLALTAIIAMREERAKIMAAAR